LHIVKAGADVAVEAADESLRLEVDVALFEEVLANLVINAIDAQPHGARIKIRVEQEGANVALHVDDNGPGIPPAKRDDVFRPFVSTKEQGTGLGLPICRKIVEEHGGSIEIGTSPLGGARFTIRLRPNLAKP
jgi:signal transduction histidine kinase